MPRRPSRKTRKKSRKSRKRKPSKTRKRSRKSRKRKPSKTRKRSRKPRKSRKSRKKSRKKSKSRKRKSRKKSRKKSKSRKQRSRTRKKSKRKSRKKSTKSRKSRRAAVLQKHTYPYISNSRKWLGGVINTSNGEFINTTTQKVKEALKRLIHPFANKVKVEVKKHKNTKFFVIFLQWNKQLNYIETSELPLGLGFHVDFYFTEDQHNQRIGNIFGYKNYGKVVLEVEPILENEPIKVAEEDLKKVPIQLGYQ